MMCDSERHRNPDPQSATANIFDGSQPSLNQRQRQPFQEKVVFPSSQMLKLQSLALHQCLPPIQDVQEQGPHLMMFSVSWRLQ
uniref:Uncharacterized protein n=1 Tax=Arundo donax TaxID=35708 RepID=A0A0A8YKX4_ARUDO